MSSTPDPQSSTAPSSAFTASAAPGPLRASASRRSVMLGAGAGTLGLLAGAAGATSAAADESTRQGEHGGHGDRRTIRLDFGPGRAARGYSKVTASTTYTADRGFGFAQGATVTETDRGGEDPLRRDFVTVEDSRFLVDLVPGDYAITLIAGDSEGETDIAVVLDEVVVLEETAVGSGEHLEHAVDHAVVAEQLAVDLSGTAANLSALVIEPLPARAPGDLPTAYLLGDSTMQTYDPYWAPQAGWGQFFDRFVDASAALVDNRSIGGRSSRSFLEQGRLDEVLLLVRPGDVVYVQFGHNDATYTVPERYTPPEDFKEYLRTYVEGTRQRGGTAVIVTPVSRLDVEESGEFAVSFPEYVEAAQEIAAELDAPLVDLSAASREYLDGIGVDAAEDVFLHADAGVYPNRPGGVTDNTHFQEYGAIQMARLVARESLSLDLPIAAALDAHENEDVPAARDAAPSTAVGPTSVTVSWESAADADVHRVLVGEADGELRFVGATAGTEWTVLGLAEAAEHRVRVVPVNEHGEGEALPDALVATAEATHRFDLGTGDSPVADGFVQVTPATEYTEERGYGLVDADGAISRDRGSDAGVDASRDFVASFEDPYEFVVDLEDGEWTVVLVVGDAIGSARTTIAIQGEERTDVAVDEGARQVLEQATVADGRLTIGISGATGHLNAVLLAPAG